MSLNFVNFCTLTEEYERRFSRIFEERGSLFSCFNGLFFVRFEITLVINLACYLCI